MLLLARRQGEAIHLYDPEGELLARILVTNGKGSVTLGIDAPESIKVLRSELQDAEASPLHIARKQAGA